MRNSTDKLHLNVPEIAFPQGSIKFEEEQELVPSGSFGVIDGQNHNFYEYYVVPLDTDRYVETLINLDPKWSPVPEILILDDLVPKRNFLGLCPIDQLHSETITIL